MWNSRPQRHLGLNVLQIQACKRGSLRYHLKELSRFQAGVHFNATPSTMTLSTLQRASIRCSDSARAVGTFKSSQTRPYTKSEADLSWLRPGVDQETSWRVLSQAWARAQCPMLLAACCLASVGHLDAIQPNRTFKTPW